MGAYSRLGVVHSNREYCSTLVHVYRDILRWETSPLHILHLPDEDVNESKSSKWQAMAGNNISHCCALIICLCQFKEATFKK